MCPLLVGRNIRIYGFQHGTDCPYAGLGDVRSTPDAVQRHEKSVRYAISKGRFDHKEHVVQGPYLTRDPCSMGQNIRDFFFGDTSVGDTLSLRVEARLKRFVY